MEKIGKFWKEHERLQKHCRLINRNHLLIICAPKLQNAQPLLAKNETFTVLKNQRVIKKFKSQEYLLTCSNYIRFKLVINNRNIPGN